MADDRVERGSTRVEGFLSGELDFQLMRSLGAGNYGGATPGEVFATRAVVNGDDPYAWREALAAMAERVLNSGQKSLERGHRISARDHFLRASMYYRAAEYFADPFGPDTVKWGLASRDAFCAAAELISDRIEPVEIPFEKKGLPGYFMAPANGAERGKTVVVLTGFDGTAEELYFQVAAAGLERGYNILIAQGPGQVGCLRIHPDLKFRPDCEKPVGAILDFALARPEVAAERLALYGISFGGYFVTRAAEHDGRIKALIANSPIVNLYAYMAGFIGPEFAANPPPVSLNEVDEIPENDFPCEAKLSFKAACRRFGVDSFATWLSRLKDFNAEENWPRFVARPSQWSARAKVRKLCASRSDSSRAYPARSRNGFSQSRKGPTPTARWGTCLSPTLSSLTGSASFSPRKAQLPDKPCACRYVEGVT